MREEGIKAGREAQTAWRVKGKEKETEEKKLKKGIKEMRYGKKKKRKDGREGV